MSQVTRRALGWGALYLGMALLPMGIALLRAPGEGRGLWVEFGAMLGLLALGVMALQAVVSGRHRWFAESLGFDNLLQFHRRMGNAALVLVLLHPLVLLTARPEWLGYLDPREEAARALTLWGLLAGTLLLVVSSLWRGRLGLSYERWRLLHGLLAFGVVAGGLGHALMVGHYTAGALTGLALVGVIGLALVALLESRLLRPWRLRRRPWRVVEVAPVRGDATTLALEPVGEHRLDFVPGQFIWITLGETPFRLQQHPFSLVSSAERPRLALTAKRLGDFTETLPEVPVGTRAFVEGPYGAFLPDVDNPSGAVLIAGGIGITPMMSMLRTFADRGERLPLWLVYANPRWEEATFREELEALAGRLSLTVIHVVDEPPAGWQGESGKLDRDLLARRLPADDGRWDYFICGPGPLMDAAEGALIELGVAPTRIYSDRFDMV